MPYYLYGDISVCQATIASSFGTIAFLTAKQQYQGKFFSSTLSFLIKKIRIKFWVCLFEFLVKIFQNLFSYFLLSRLKMSRVH